MIKQIIVGLLQTNCYLYSYNKNDCLIIDPGGNSEDIINTIQALNLNPKGIALTHGHLDHSLACNPLIAFFKKHAGIELGITIHKNEAQYVGIKSVNMHQGLLSYLALQAVTDLKKFAKILPPEAAQLFKEGDNVYATDLRVIETPGHTQGSVCFYSEKEDILFSGDTLFYQGIGRTDSKGGNYQQIINSIKNKLITLPLQTKVYPGHGIPTTIGFEMKNNPFLT